MSMVKRETSKSIDPFDLDDDLTTSEANYEAQPERLPKALCWEQDHSLTDDEMGFDRGRPLRLHGLRGYRLNGAKKKWPILTVAVWADPLDPGAGFSVTCKWRRRLDERMEVRTIPTELLGDVISMLTDVTSDLYRSRRNEARRASGV